VRERGGGEWGRRDGGESRENMIKQLVQDRKVVEVKVKVEG
jgi:hypothetical protein